MLRGLDLALVEAEGTEQQVQVIHAPVADAPQGPATAGSRRARSRMARSIGSSPREKVSASARHSS